VQLRTHLYRPPDLPRESCEKSGVPSIYERIRRDQVAGPRRLPCEGCALHGHWRTRPPGRSQGILQGLFDPDRLGNNWRGLAIRASFMARGALHAVLGWQAFRLYRGLSAASGTSEREVATEAFRWPLGDWLVVLAGLGLIGFAVQQVYAAITRRFERNLDVEQMRREAGEWAVGLSRFGVAARAVVFALLGWAIVVAGWFRDPSEVGTTASSFRTLAAQPGGLGRWLLGVTAAGFVAYGFYEIIHARYLHIRRVR
jgi:hypothetical protein